MIYGMALLAGCMLIGSYMGRLLGLLTGLNSDIGGVGFAMVFLLIATNSKKMDKLLPKGYTKGIEFWKDMFIPVVIALSASQNVVSALDGGILAIVAGVGTVLVMFLMVPLFNRFISKPIENEDGGEAEV